MTKVEITPYEILLRFNCERGEKVGDLRGCHRVMATYLVDDERRIVGRVQGEDRAAEFPPEELEKYLGAQPTAFIAKIDAVSAELRKSEEACAELQSALVHANRERDRALGESNQLRNELSQLRFAQGKVKEADAPVT